MVIRERHAFCVFIVACGMVIAFSILQGNELKSPTVVQKAVVGYKINVTLKCQSSPVFIPWYPHITFPENPWKICSGKQDLLLLIAVSTAMQNAARRTLIRETWGSWTQVESLGVKMVFVVGEMTNNKAKNSELKKLIAEESRVYGDIVQANHVDTHRKLVYKTAASLKWFQMFCCRAKYFMKADDDIFLHIPNLVWSLRRQKTSQTALGLTTLTPRRFQTPLPSTASVPSIGLQETVPPSKRIYRMHGPAYILSREIVMNVYEAAQDVPLVMLEDVYFAGLCLLRLGVKPANLTGFELLSDHAVHHQTPLHKLAGLFKYNQLLVYGHKLRSQDIHFFWRMTGEVGPIVR